MIESLTIRLPMPPSVNASYATRKGPGPGRVATKALRDWKASAGAQLRETLADIPQRPVFAGLVDVEIQLPVSWASDADNRIKAVPDLLKACGVLIDDKARYVRSVRAVWIYDDSLGDQIEVSVSQIADAPAQRPQGGRTAAKAPRRASAEGRKETASTRQRRASQALSAHGAGSCAETDTACRAAAKRPCLVSTQQPEASPALDAPAQARKRKHQTANQLAVTAQNGTNEPTGCLLGGDEKVGKSYFKAETIEKTNTCGRNGVVTKARRPSPKASAASSIDTVVRNVIASRLGIDPGRVHLTGGNRG